MSDGFRFPKITWILMTAILAAVVWAIAKGEAISTSLSPANPALPPAHAILPSWALSLLLMYAVGVILGGVLFALRRKGILGKT